MTQRQNNWNEAKACKVENGATSTSSIETNTSKEYQRQIGRRSFLGQSAGLALTSSLLPVAVYCNQGQSKLPVAAIVTEYRVDSHADVIVGKILAGYDQKGGPGPKLELVSLYTDQVPESDLSRELAKKYGFHIVSSVEEALTLGTNRLQVAGVLSIGEHGKYPSTPDTRQRMYPRRRFFDAIVDVFQKVGKSVPVFNDKHLSYRWEDAKHMVDTASRMKFPLMAGSSLPVAWRRPAIEFPVECEIEQALAIGYGGLEDYGFHALETLQCMVERRKGGETGVESIHVLRGDAIREGAEKGEWSKTLFDAALSRMPDSPIADLTKLNDDAAFYQIQYRDGLKATVAMAIGIANHFSFAAKLKDRAESVSTLFELEGGRPFGHFSYLLRAIESMIHTGKTPYPVERTLLTTGILDAVMHSLKDGGISKPTPELAMSYRPTDWPFANRSE